MPNSFRVGHETRADVERKPNRQPRAQIAQEKLRERTLKKCAVQAASLPEALRAGRDVTPDVVSNKLAQILSLVAFHGVGASLRIDRLRNVPRRSASDVKLPELLQPDAV